MVDLRLDENLVLATNNLPTVRVVTSGRVTARDVMNADHIIVTKASVEHLAQVLTP